VVRAVALAAVWLAATATAAASTPAQERHLLALLRLRVAMKPVELTVPAAASPLAIVEAEIEGMRRATCGARLLDPIDIVFPDARLAGASGARCNRLVEPVLEQLPADAAPAYPEHERVLLELLRLRIDVRPLAGQAPAAASPVAIVEIAIEGVRRFLCGSTPRMPLTRAFPDARVLGAETARCNDLVAAAQPVLERAPRASAATAEHQRLLLGLLRLRITARSLDGRVPAAASPAAIVEIEIAGVRRLLCPSTPLAPLDRAFPDAEVRTAEGAHCNELWQPAARRRRR
jgi:hypothetical protein